MVVSEHRYAALPAELAGSLVLAVADALNSLSLRVGPQEIVLLEDGTVRVCGGIPSDEVSAERSLRHLLDRMLLSSCSVTPALLRAARRPCQGRASVLVHELEIALIPTNRGAARRALARLCREVTHSMLQYPELQQSADALQIADTVSIESTALVSATPVPVAVAESEDQEEWIEVSPIFPEAIPSAEKYDSANQFPVPVSRLDIPDLEIPDVAKRDHVQDSPGWQPVEHTQTLSFARSSQSQPILPTLKAPDRPNLAAPAANIDLEFIELSDDDLHEVTAELQSNLADNFSKYTPIITNSTSSDQKTPFEYQTAEPFLLVLPSLEQEAREAESVISPASSEPTYTSDAAAREPGDEDSQDTVLDVVTFIEDGLPASCVAEQEILPPRNLGPHTYAAPARFSRTPSNVSSRIASSR